MSSSNDELKGLIFAALIAKGVNDLNTLAQQLDEDWAIRKAIKRAAAAFVKVPQYIAGFHAAEAAILQSRPSFEAALLSAPITPSARPHPWNFKRVTAQGEEAQRISIRAQGMVSSYFNVLAKGAPPPTEADHVKMLKPFLQGFLLNNSTRVFVRMGGSFFPLEKPEDFTDIGFNVMGMWVGATFKNVSFGAYKRLWDHSTHKASSDKPSLEGLSWREQRYTKAAFRAYSREMGGQILKLFPKLSNTYIAGYTFE